MVKLASDPVWTKKYRDGLKIARKKYYTKPRALENRRAYYRRYNKKVRSNPSNRIRDSLSARLNALLRGRKKTKCTRYLVGCSLDELKIHLESQFKPGMSWENYGLKGWHIDHIIPCSFFDLTKLDEQKKAFNYTNLQPLWAKDNIRKSNKVFL